MSFLPHQIRFWLQAPHLKAKRCLRYNNNWSGFVPEVAKADPTAPPWHRAWIRQSIELEASRCDAEDASFEIEIVAGEVERFKREDGEFDKGRLRLLQELLQGKRCRLVPVLQTVAAI